MHLKERLNLRTQRKKIRNHVITIAQHAIEDLENFLDQDPILKSGND